MSEESFRRYYESLTDDQLLQIMADKADLVPEAAAALDGEVRRRQIKLPEPERWVREPGSDEQVRSLEDYCEYRQLERKRRYVHRYSYFVAIGPFVLGLVIARHAVENSMAFFILSMTWAMCIAVYGLLISFRFLAYKCPQCSERFGRGAECFSCGFPRSATQVQK